MSTRANVAFVAVFLLVIVALSWWDQGEIAWPLVIGGAVGAATGVLLASYIRRRRSSQASDQL